MDFLLELNLNDGDDLYLGYGTHIVGGKQYLNVINKIDKFTRVLTTGTNFQTPSLSVKFKDDNKIIRSHFADEVDRQKNKGSYGALKDISGNTLQKLKLTGFDTEGHYTTLKFTQNTDLIKNNLLDVISEKEYPDAAADAYGKEIPYLHGGVDGGGTSGSYSAWKVNLDIGGGTILHYLLADCTLASVDRVVEDGVNRSSGWTLHNHTDGRAYLIFSTGTADTVEVNVTRTISTVSGFFSDIFDDLFGSYGYTPTTAFLNRMERALDSGTGFYSPCFTRQLKGDKFMDYFRQAFGVDWYIGSDGEIKLSWLDIASQVGNEVATFRESDVSGFSLSDPEDVKNKILYKFKYLNTEGQYKHNFFFHKTESQDNAGICDDKLENRFTDYDRPAFAAAKYYSNCRQYPVTRATVTFKHEYNVEKFLDMNLGDIIKLTHSQALSDDARYYRIERMDFDLHHNSVVCILQDVCWLSNIADIVFLFQSGFSGVTSESQYVYDFAPNYSHGIQKYGDIKHSTTQAFFKSASLKFTAGDLQAIAALKKSTTNFFKLQGDSYNFILCSWFRPEADQNEALIMGLWEDSSNYIATRLKENNQLGNGGFEIAGGGGSDVFGSWSEYTAGSSTITRQGTNPYSGSYCCELLPESSGNSCYVYQSFTLAAGENYNLSLYFRCSYSLSNCQIQIKDSGSNVWLDSSGNWQTSPQTITTSQQTSWTNLSLNFTAHASYTNYVIYLKPGAWQNATNKFYYDQVVVKTQGGNEYKLNLQLVDTGVIQMDVDSAGCCTSLTKYFLLLAKIGTAWGVYIGESGGIASQVIYGSYAAGDFLDPYIISGKKLDNSEYISMYADEILAIRTNAWSLAPVSGLTDSLAVPSSAFTDRLVS